MRAVSTLYETRREPVSYPTLTDLVSKDFAQSKRGKYLLGMHTEMDARLSAPAIAEIFHALQKRDLTARLPELKCRC